MGNLAQTWPNLSPGFVPFNCPSARPCICYNRRMPGSSTDLLVSVDQILYGQTGARNQVKLIKKDDRLLGVADNPYPSNFVPGETWFPEAIVDNAVTKLKSHTVVPDHSKVVGDLQAALPNWHWGEAARPWETGRDQLHVLVIERLPSWSKPKKQNGVSSTRYGQHLGIGIYVYDPERDRWYQRAMHGRSFAAAHRLPLKTVKTATAKMRSLREQIVTNSFNVAEDMPEGYPLALSRLNDRI